MIYYFLPSSDGPTGGHKVAYQHVTHLNSLGLPAAIIHPRGYTYRDWVGKRPPVVGIDTHVGPEDLVVVPEILAEAGAKFTDKTGARFAIVNFDAYLGLTLGSLEAHRKAEFIMTDGEDTHYIISSHFGVDKEKLHKFPVALDWDWWSAPTERKENLIAAIPRKRPFEWNITRTLLEGRIPGWQIAELENRPVEEVRELFARAKIVVGLGKFESTSIQYLEAAAARCRVVGFDGFGCQEYWHRPIYTHVRNEDPIGLLESLIEATKEPEHWTPGCEVQRTELAKRYSAENERLALEEIYKCHGFARQ